MRAKYGLVVFRAERAHFLQVAHEFGIDLLQVQHCVDINLGNQLFGHDFLRRYLLEPLLETLQVLLFQGKSGSISMPANVLQQVPAALHDLVDVEVGNRTGRTGYQFG